MSATLQTKACPRGVPGSPLGKLLEGSAKLKEVYFRAIGTSKLADDEPELVTASFAIDFVAARRDAAGDLDAGYQRIVWIYPLPSNEGGVYSFSHVRAVSAAGVDLADFF